MVSKKWELEKRGLEHVLFMNIPLRQNAHFMTTYMIINAIISNHNDYPQLHDFVVESNELVVFTM
jgi:hypothetical protein